MPKFRHADMELRFTQLRDSGTTPAAKVRGDTRAMTIFGRYVFRQATGALLLILLSLTGVVWIALALRELNVVTSQGQSGFTLIAMTTLAVPNFMGVIAPFALLIAVLHTLNRLNNDSELISFTAAGASVWTVARPLILLGCIVSAFVAFVNHFAQPWSFRQLREYILEVRTDLLTQVIQPGKFSSPEAGLTLHIRERATSGELLGLIMHDARDKNETRSYLADRGLIVKQQDNAYLIMNDGHVVRRPDKDEPSQIIAFQRYIVDLAQFEPQTSELTDLRPRERYYSELTNPEPGSALFKKSPGQFRSELHERFSGPLYPLAFVMLGLVAVGQAQSVRQNRVERVAMGGIFAAATRVAGLAIGNLIVLNAGWVPAAYAVPALTIALCFATIMRHSRRQLPLSRLARWNDAVLQALSRVRWPWSRRATAAN